MPLTGPPRWCWDLRRRPSDTRHVETTKPCQLARCGKDHRVGGTQPETVLDVSPVPAISCYVKDFRSKPELGTSICFWLGLGAPGVDRVPDFSGARKTETEPGWLNPKRSVDGLVSHGQETTGIVVCLDPGIGWYRYGGLPGKDWIHLLFRSGQARRTGVEKG